MNMQQAIAESAGNKARGYSDNGHIIIVQQRFSEFGVWWYHIWRIEHDGATIYEIDQGLVGHMQTLLEVNFIDPTANYWGPV